MRACVLALSFLVAAGARAQDTPPIDARVAFEAGRAAFAESRYEDALAAFERALELAPHDAVRFNIAVSLEHLGRIDEALEHYRIAAGSDELDDAGLVRAAREVDRLEAVLRNREVEQAPEPEPTPLPEPTPPPRTASAVVDAPSSRTAWLAIGGAVVAGAGVAGIVYFGLRAQSLHDEWEASPTDEDLAGRGTTMRDLANVSIGVAALGAVLVLLDVLFLSSGDAPSEARALRTQPHFRF
jgi:tetratricopeptide (TPR) repeat protein